MYFDFSDDYKQIAAEGRKFLEGMDTVKKHRAVVDNDKISTDSELWAAIVEQGWTGVCIPEEYGGLGLEPLALCLIAEEIGRVIAPVPFGSTLYHLALFVNDHGTQAQKSRVLPLVVSGEPGTFASQEPNRQLREDTISTVYANGKVSGVKTAVLDGLQAKRSIVLAREGNAIVNVLVEHNDDVVIEEQKSIDPSRSYAQITYHEAKGEVIGNDGWQDFQTHLDKSSVLFAFEQVGGADAALDMAKAYALGRYAFGRTIASFQAVKHRMADMYIQNQLARSNAYFAAWALNNNAPELAVAAATARVGASEAFNYAAKENIQLHGGMGFTWEFDCHLYYRRAKALSLVTGGQHEWRDKLVTALQRKNKV